MQRLDAAVPHVEIHQLDFDLDANPLRDGCDLLPAERARAMVYVRPADQVRQAHTRVALRRLLACRLACPPCDVPLSVDRLGKPIVGLQGGPVFNVSHSGGHALIAIGCGRSIAHMGIDIEQHRSDIDVHAVGAQVFSPEEREAFAATQAGFYRGWVLKEALLKAVGVGVAEHLSDVSIYLGEGAAPRFACPSHPSWAAFHAAELPAPPGYAAAVAWRTKDIA